MRLVGASLLPTYDQRRSGIGRLVRNVVIYTRSNCNGAPNGLLCCSRVPPDPLSQPVEVVARHHYT